MTQPSLFPMDVPEPEPAPDGGQAAQLTIRQARKLRLGIHPATGLALHEQAADPGDRKAPGLRCKGCAHLVRKRAGGGEWLKCDLAGRTPYGDLTGPDARAWWPACNQYQERDEEDQR